MVKQVIEIGTAPAGQDGDTNREASIKINSNFTELYVAIGNVVRGPSMAIGGEVAVFSGTTGKDIVGGGVLGSAAFQASNAFKPNFSVLPVAQGGTGNLGGLPNGFATLGADGKLPVAQLPPLAVNEVFTVASQAAMLALTAERGDVAVRTDQEGKTYILSQDNPTILANWVPLTQAMSAALAALNALTPAADRIPYFTGPSTAALLSLSTVGKALIAAVDAAAARSAIAAAKSGQNSDITELTGIATPLSRPQGGIGGYIGFIEGLTMSWLSSTSVSIDAGSAYIPSLGRVVTFAGQTFQPMGVVDVNSFIYLYLTDTGTIQQSLTAPVRYSNQAWQMSGNNARRCIGALHVTTNANGVTKFVHRPQLGLILYTLGNPQASPFRLLAGVTGIGSITTRTVTPVTAHTMEGTFQNTGTLAARVTPSDAGTNVATGWMAFINPGQIWNAKMAIAADGSITYDATSPAALSVYCHGYYFDR